MCNEIIQFPDKFYKFKIDSIILKLVYCFLKNDLNMNYEKVKPT